MAKDPLQPEKNPDQQKDDPYVVLGVSPNATDDEIKAAYKEKVEIGDQGVDTVPFDDARKLLLNPERRKEIDRSLAENATLSNLFSYQDAFLEKLAFKDQIETLKEPDIRRHVGQQWRDVEKTGFPNLAATHSIAVISYWEAISSGEKGQKSLSSLDMTADLWNAALVRFAALCASRDFWSEWTHLTDFHGDREEIAKKLEGRLESELKKIVTDLEKNDDIHGANRFQEHLALFRSELLAARALSEFRIFEDQAPGPIAIYGGPHLLGEVGLLEKVRTEIEARSPDQLPYFSPLAHIRQLIKNQDLEIALAALDRLNPTERDKNDARELDASILLELSLKELAADRDDDAFKKLEQALDLTEDRSQLLERVSKPILDRADHRYNLGDLEAAIVLLQRVLSYGAVSMLGERLAHYLLERANAGIALATAEAEKGSTDTAVAELRSAVTDLEEAANHDPENLEIQDRRDEADELLQRLLPSKIPEPLTKICPACSTPNPVDAKFCSACRFNFEKGRKTLQNEEVLMIVGALFFLLVLATVLVVTAFGGGGFGEKTLSANEQAAQQGAWTQVTTLTLTTMPTLATQVVAPAKKTPTVTPTRTPTPGMAVHTLDPEASGRFRDGGVHPVKGNTESAKYRSPSLTRNPGYPVISTTTPSVIVSGPGGDVPLPTESSSVLRGYGYATGPWSWAGYGNWSTPMMHLPAGPISVTITSPGTTAIVLVSEMGTAVGLGAFIPPASALTVHIPANGTYVMGIGTANLTDTWQTTITFPTQTEEPVPTFVPVTSLSTIETQSQTFTYTGNSGGNPPAFNLSPGTVHIDLSASQMTMAYLKDASGATLSTTVAGPYPGGSTTAISTAGQYHLEVWGTGMWSISMTWTGASSRSTAVT